MSAGERKSTISRMISWGRTELPTSVLAFIGTASTSTWVSSYTKYLDLEPNGTWKRDLRLRRRFDLDLNLGFESTDNEDEVAEGWEELVDRCGAMPVIAVWWMFETVSVGWRHKDWSTVWGRGGFKDSWRRLRQWQADRQPFVWNGIQARCSSTAYVTVPRYYICTSILGFLPSRFIS